MHAAQCRGVNAHAGSCQEQETERNMALVGGPAFTAVRAGAIGLDACAAESLEFRCKLGISKLSAKAPVRGFLSHQAMDICIVEVLLDGKNNNDGRMLRTLEIEILDGRTNGMECFLRLQGIKMPRLDVLR